MEGVESRKALVMKYRRKSEIPSSFGSSTLSSDLQTNSSELLTDPQSVEERPQAAPYSTSKEAAHADNQKFIKDVEDLKPAIKQQPEANSDIDNEPAVLQKEVHTYAEIIQAREFQLMELNSSLLAKEEELAELKKQLLSSKALVSLQEKELAQLKQRFDKCNCELQKEREQTGRQEDVISSLKRSLAEAKQMEETLDDYLSKQTAGNKQVEEELRFVIQRVNEEKDELSKKFQIFKEAASFFLQSYQKHNNIVLEAVEEGKRFLTSDK